MKHLIVKHSISHVFNISKCMSFSSISSSTILTQELEIRHLLRTIIEPSTKQNIVSLGLVNKVDVVGNNIRIEMNSFLPGYKHVHEIQQACEVACKTLPWQESISIVSNQNELITSQRSVSLSSNVA